MRKYVFWLLLPFLINGVCINLYSDKINLRELRKKEEERKKKDKKKKIVITNDNIDTIVFKNSKYSVIQMKLNNKNTTKGTGLVGSKTIVDPTKTKKYWQRIKNKLLSQIEELTEIVNKQQLRVNKLNIDYLIMDMPNRKKNIKDQLDDQTRKLSNNKLKLKKLQDEFSSLSDKARKAGIPPGWIR